MSFSLHRQSARPRVLLVSVLGAACAFLAGVFFAKPDALHILSSSFLSLLSTLTASLHTSGLFHPDYDLGSSLRNIFTLTVVIFLALALYKLLDTLDRIMGLRSDIRLFSRILPGLARLRNKLKPYAPDADGVVSGYTMTDLWVEAVTEFPDKVAVEFENRCLTFMGMERVAAAMAWWLYHKQGIRKNDTVMLCMENKPEFICWWLAITRLGCAVGFLNTNVKKKGLVHCVQVLGDGVKALICDEDTEGNVAEVANELVGAGKDKNGFRVIYWGGKNPRLLRGKEDVCQELDFSTERDTITHDDLLGMPGVISDLIPYVSQETSINDASINISPKDFPKSLRKGVVFSDIFGYIYTSGTTGMPKAAKVNHMKMYAAGLFMKALCKVHHTDRLYSCLPLFHSAGGGIAVVSMMHSGCTLVLSRKFSSRRFWKEVVDKNCTIIQYIGELARYLLTAPPPPNGCTNHRVRLAFGNGLRPDIWGQFQNRFGIPQVGEFYAATEGVGTLINLCDLKDTLGCPPVVATDPASTSALASAHNTQGAVGMLGKLGRKIHGNTVIVRFDVVEEEVIRDPESGFCTECSDNESGELLFLTDPEKQPWTKFAGYTDDKSTTKKLLRDVFKSGDCYFRSGDLLMRDRFGRYFFVDRIGDTFRWKGENVSTTEVGEAVSRFFQEELGEAGEEVEVNVYGVSIPNSPDGRACCVAISGVSEQLKNPEFMERLLHYCQAHLPPYAVPVFLRDQRGSGRSPEEAGITPSSDSRTHTTATFKQQKVALRNQGCDPSLCGRDVLYYLGGAQTRGGGNSYEELTMARFVDELGGKAGATSAGELGGKAGATSAGGGGE